MIPTIQQVVANVMIAVNNRTPYVFGGTNLYTGADCSGMLYAALVKAGVANPARTSQAQFAAWAPAPGPAFGVAVFFNVPSDGPPQPQHVGICLTAATMAQEPHTGLTAEITPIPNIPGVESIMGYRYLPVSYVPAPAPAPAPAPTPPQEDDMAFQMTDPQSGKVCATDANGNFYSEGIADLNVCTLGEHPAWKAGEAESAGQNPCVGLVPWRDTNGLWGYAYVTKPAGGSGSLGPYSLYHINRNGTPA